MTRLVSYGYAQIQCRVKEELVLQFICHISPASHPKGLVLAVVLHILVVHSMYR